MKVNLENNLWHTTLIKSNFLKKIDSGLKNNQAIFWDRDGVIIKDCHYINNINQVEILSGVHKLLNYSIKKGWHNIVITNQSGISRGYFDWKDYEKINRKMINLIDLRVTFDAIYGNGERDIINNSSWRKPSPQMLLRAKFDHKIDLNRSILIGDRLTDLIAGQKAGLKILCHVLTGKGLNERDQILNHFKLKLENNNYSGIFNLGNSNQKIYLLKDLNDFDLTILKN